MKKNKTKLNKKTFQKKKKQTKINSKKMEPKYREHLSEPWFSLISLGLKT